LKLGKYRRQHGLFVAEGTTNVIDFLNSNIQVDEVYATVGWIENHKNETRKVDIVEVNEKELKKVSFLTNPSDVIGIFQIPKSQKPDLQSVNDLLLLLDDIRDPGNFGTIIRTADWFGIREIICSEESVDAFNPKVVQASMGSLSRVLIQYTDLVSLLETKPGDLKLFGTFLEGDPVHKIEKPKRGIVLIGNEAHGISNDLLPFIDQQITIPVSPATSESSAESLNAAIAAAIVLYEFRR